MNTPKKPFALLGLTIALSLTTGTAFAKIPFEQDHQNNTWQSPSSEQYQQGQPSGPSTQRLDNQTQSRGTPRFQQGQQTHAGTYTRQNPQPTPQHQEQVRRQQQQSHMTPQGQPNAPFQTQRPTGGQFSQHQTPHQSAPYQVGDKLPSNYHDKNHRINHATHGLPAPAKNETWVHIDGRYLLVNTITHAIVQILLGN